MIRTDRIRSFVLRAGRTTAGQQRAIEELGPQFLIPYQATNLNLNEAFQGSSKPKILEIGFGMGETTAKIAALRSEDDFLAIEVHPPGVGALLKLIGENHLTNLRLIRHDAVEVLEQMIATDSLDGIHIYFADPWHKKRHHKRRLIQAEFVRLLVSLFVVLKSLLFIIQSLFFKPSGDLPCVPLSSPPSWLSVPVRICKRQVATSPGLPCGRRWVGGTPPG